MDEWDLIIVGGGPAGLTAGIYGVRAELKTLVIESELLGGKIGTAGLVENYPGFPGGILGAELAERMRRQAEETEIVFRSPEKVEEIRKEKRRFFVQTDRGTYLGKAVIIATGMRDKKIGVPGEKEFYGRGVTYCFTCDGPLYRGKRVAVLGSGTGAVEAAVYLDDLAEEVKLVMKASQPYTAERIMKTRLKRSGVEILPRRRVKEILGKESVTGLRIEDLESGEEAEIEVDGVFVEIGKKPNTDFLRGMVEMDEKGFIVVDMRQRTNVEGLYAAGDVATSNFWKQLGVAVGEGTTASIDAYNYIRNL
jgi:thioredoxin reductase (NADPH)